MANYWWVTSFSYDKEVILMKVKTKVKAGEGVGTFPGLPGFLPPYS